ncbi:MAG: FIST C-terminal domain-containing protein [Defluviitaleaceae bacterium]|nr:FIST C-terminal domain-containing protein [Defluviitaleaceae bacterium]
MIRTASVQTYIIDDIELACRELQEQLNEKLSLLSNSVGIVQCDPEFIESGIMESLHSRLRFPLVGGTTVSIATNDEIDNYMFSMLVLTSDDVEFAVSHTTGLVDDYAGAIERSMKASLNDSEKPLKMALVFPTVTDNEDLPGDIYVEIVESLCGDVPVFGTLSVNDAVEKFERSMSVCNGKAFKSELTYVLIFGNVSPRFFVAAVPPQSNVIDTVPMITRSEGHIVKEINDMLAVKYFENIGFAINGKLASGINFVPLLVTMQDSGGVNRTFVRAVIGFDSNGFAVCRGKIPEGAQIAFASLQAADILAATSEIVTQINQEQDVAAALFFSCIIRQLSIGSDPLKELTIIKDSLRADIPFVASYSGGEISPIICNIQSSYKNSFHNYSLIACLL